MGRGIGGCEKFKRRIDAETQGVRESFEDRALRPIPGDSTPSDSMAGQGARVSDACVCAKSRRSHSRLHPGDWIPRRPPHCAAGHTSFPARNPSRRDGGVSPQSARLGRGPAKKCAEVKVDQMDRAIRCLAPLGERHSAWNALPLANLLAAVSTSCSPASFAWTGLWRTWIGRPPGPSMFNRPSLSFRRSKIVLTRPIRQGRPLRVRRPSFRSH